MVVSISNYTKSFYNSSITSGFIISGIIKSNVKLLAAYIKNYIILNILLLLKK